MPENNSSYIVVRAREEDVDFSLKKRADDELVIYSTDKQTLLPIEVESGEYVCAYRSRKTGSKGSFKVAVGENKVIKVVIPPYGR